jgi:alkylation response protein AidB-like acyl-CoA dehydrogenase
MNDGFASPRENVTGSLQRQIARLCLELEAALAAGDFDGFYASFRSSDLPYLPVIYEGQTLALFTQCFDLLHRLGGISPATALAVENHFYVFSTIATFPTQSNEGLDSKRRALLAAVKTNRWLVANTNSKIHSNTLGAIGTMARPENGGFRISGRAAYTSLATRGDLLVFITEIEDSGPAVFAISPMQENPAIEIGALLFPEAMIDSDTRQITFRDLFVGAESLITNSNGKQTAMLVSFEMAWHQLLIPALYLGAAARAIEEIRLFLRNTNGRDGRPLSDLDGMLADVGRLAIIYENSCSAVRQAGEELSKVRRLPEDTNQLERASELASAAKYAGTRNAEHIVTEARRIVGARCFVGGHPIERLTQEIGFGSLGPEVSAVIERRFGKRALGQSPFIDFKREIQGE